ncbi:hypothetical protein LJR290_007502 [Variovorax sp. LjRoot290]|uniref:hypothetical protein n=1 Tax=Variovorax sp. LjRoot290 TaxID=3342316 RepID=UPI003ED15406
MSSVKTQALLRRVASGSAPEQAFWKAVVSCAHEARPNWGLDLHAGRTPLAADSYVYLVDTSSHWIAAAAISPSQLALVRTDAGETTAVESRARAAAAMERASARAGAGEGAMFSPETLTAFAAGITAIATSPAFAAAAKQPHVLENHHWILLLYRLTDGHMIAGLGYVDDPYPGMLDMASVREYVSSMVEMDLSSVGSTVSEAVGAHGGVMLASALSQARPD